MKLEPVRYLYRINCILQDTNLGTHLVALTLSFIEMLRAKLESSVLLILIKKLTMQTTRQFTSNGFLFHDVKFCIVLFKKINLT